MKGALAGTLVAGLNLKLNRWVAHASGDPGIATIPELDGELVFDDRLVDSAADDYGHIISNSPMAVLLPGSVDDVIAMVQYANQNGLRIGGMGMVGDAHSTYGQSQVRAGIVIDMSRLSQIHEINASDVLVDAGVRWRDLVAATVAVGKSPLTLTDYTGISVGGTLSVGGIGGQVHQHGMQVDQVLELHVVTGSGNLEVCSAIENRQLFDAVRGGLGQFGIIVGARLRLRDVPSMARVYTARYANINSFMADQEQAIRQHRFDYVEGQAVRTSDGSGWEYMIELVKYYEPGSEPDDDALLRGLSFRRSSLIEVSMSYYDFVCRIDPVMEELKRLNLWQKPHPWLNLFLPRHKAAKFIKAVIRETSEADMGGGPILIYPFLRSAVQAPYPVLPNDEVCYLFSMLRTATSGTPEQVADMLEKNRLIYDLARMVGGVLYPISAMPMDASDWRCHLAPWQQFVARRDSFDPNRVLTPGHGIPSQ